METEWEYDANEARLRGAKASMANASHRARTAIDAGEERITVAHEDSTRKGEWVPR
jgi:hypothetical protein